MVFISGSQSAGKTTLFNYLKDFYPQAKFQPEINPYTLVGKHSGGAFVTTDLQKEISRLTIEQFKRLSKPAKKRLVFWETGFMNLAYVLRDGKGENYLYFKKEYLKLASLAEVKVVFIDTRPEVSWQIRRANYLKRVQEYLEDNHIKEEKREEVTQLRMARYKKNLWLMYPLFKETLEVLNLPTYVIENNGSSLEEFLDKGRQLIGRIVGNDR